MLEFRKGRFEEAQVYSLIKEAVFAQMLEFREKCFTLFEVYASVEIPEYFRVQTVV